MNKRFSTLLAIALMAGGLSASAQSVDKYTPDGVLATGIQPTKNYYHIKAVGTDTYLTATRDAAGSDSIATMYPQSGAFSCSAALDSAMWQIDLTVGVDSVFSFTNKVTGAKLSVAKEGTAVVKDGISSWAWKTTAGGYITNGSSLRVDTLSTSVDGIPAHTVVVTKDGKFGDEAVAGVAWMIVKADKKVALSAEDLNGMNGGYFNLAFGNDAAVNPFTKYKIEAIAICEGGDATYTDSVMFRAIGADAIKNDWTGKAGNDSLFIVSDTLSLHSAPAGASWSADKAGYKFALDTLVRKGQKGGIFNAVEGDTLAANGRDLSTYKFLVTACKDRIAGDSLIIATSVSKGVSADPHTDFINTKGVSTDVVVGISNDATGTKIVTTLESETNTLIEFPQGSKYTGLDDSKKYFIQYTGGTNKGKYFVVAFTKDQNAPATGVAASASPLVPATQWAVKKLTSGNYTIFNREFASKTFRLNQPIYEAGDAGYKTSADDKNTFKFIEVGTTDEYVGYKHFTPVELGTSSVALNFNTSFGDDVPVYLKDKDSILYAAKGETAVSFKLAEANGGAATYGDKLKRQAYFLKEFLGDRVLGKDANGNLKLTKRLDGTRDTVAVLLRATEVANKYQLVVLNGQDVYTDDKKTFNNEVDMAGDSLVATAGGTEGKLFTEKLSSLLAGSFSVEFPDLPDFVNVTEDKPAHMVIRSTANNSLAITMGAKGAALLKSTSDLKADSYSEDNLKMYVDTAIMTDAAKPTYYICTTQGVDSEDVEAGVANYLSIKDGKVSFVAGKQFGLNGVDSLLVGDDKEYAPKAQFLFANTKTEGQYKIYNEASNSYLAQKNGVIVVADVDDALPFTTEVVDTPTGNESTEANTISVVAGEGNVTVYGAAGKKVTVSNVLGQKTTIVATSDSEVIAAPQGVVIIAVEGEAAVKAVVK
ncbi:DUF6383 domain-containing protein [Parabacteroides chinchillae]|uniref:DUF6383 domain-containing protein n=1 Tax=Parabacteroides chinchillae TaxID=871327 RepID=A0A8G2BUT0_9BACT|nr:DUF6383 domain-containing protein [Parabacteroides chinchillae]SEF60735.1 hypothetical protein SAMN05444001_103110 [Parabacteroides chinchillae]